MKSLPKRLRPDLRLEGQFTGFVCGLDEAGRGPLAGPVVAACVYIPENVRSETFWREVNDSKKLSEKKRDALFELILAHTQYGIAQSSVREIDQINILQASLQAMTRAFNKMPHHGIVEEKWMALVDGNQKPKLPCQIQTVVKGDSISLSIAAASILAKVTRDRIMKELCVQFPMYGWSHNAGYGTAEHMKALQLHGITDHHRKTFSPVRMIADKDAA